MGIRCTARPGLLSGQFRHGPVYVREGTWTEFEADDPEVRKVLLEFVPSHVRVAHGYEIDLTAAGLTFDGAHLVDSRALAAADKAAAEAAEKAKQPKEKAPRAEK